MVTIKTLPDKKWLIILTNAVITIITTIIIVWSFPNESGPNFPYYEINKPWTSKTLIAEFNFYSFRSKSEIESDKQNLLREYNPLYIMDFDVEEQAVADFKKAVAKDSTGMLGKYSDLIERRLHFLYGQGIIDEYDRTELANDSTWSIRVVRDKLATPTEIVNIPTESQAFRRIFADEELAEHEEQLEKLTDLNVFIRSNLRYDSLHNETEIKELEESVPTIIGEVLKNEKIIGTGEMVDKDTKHKIDSYVEELKKRNPDDDGLIYRTIGQALLVFIFILLFTCYLRIYRKQFYSHPLNIVMLYIMTLALPVTMSLALTYTTLSIYIWPFAIVPMITQVFFDSRTAFITLTTTVLISAIPNDFQYEFITIEMAAGMAAIYSLSDMAKRSQLFSAAFMATLCAMLTYFSLQLITNNTKELTYSDQNMFAYLITSGIFLLLAYPMMYVIEKLFGFTTNITFFELSDTNQELLRMLSEKAPGTFAHSTTVGNLAAEVANRIGANPLLVRTGALYHDIGKMANAVFFVENQAGVNPHDKLSEKGREKESARIIINHVIEGLRLAEKYDLPDVITDFIRTHHGKGIAKFFYVQYKNKHPEEDVDIEQFTYPGPNPQTREQAIIMMTDTVEAATKSLPVYSDETISKKVDELIDNQVKAGYFEECPITFRDIAIAKIVLAEKLKSIYHTRITYPKLNNEEQEAEQTTQPKE